MWKRHSFSSNAVLDLHGQMSDMRISGTDAAWLPNCRASASEGQALIAFRSVGRCSKIYMISIYRTGIAPFGRTRCPPAATSQKVEAWGRLLHKASAHSIRAYSAD